MLKVISSENFNFQSYQNKNHKGLIVDTMNKNTNSADVRRLTKATRKAAGKPLLLILLG